MSYLFENLGDEKFQRMCHAIINSEFPNSQAFPVGQPDGGRDSIVYLSESKKKEFIVFQVKYVKNPNQDDPHKWLIKILTDEAPKIDKLIPKGAIKFVLMTNARGTAHLEVGAIDKVNALLEEQIRVPALCWWRDDISGKLDSNNDIKWSYSEILNGQDLLNKFVFENISEDRQRREGVVRAYLKDQYDLDDEVKFKQIELQNKLLSLYTDVPLSVKKINEKDRGLKRSLRELGLLAEGNQEIMYLRDIGESFEIGAANFILNTEIKKGINRILLEGGPGQGKSTISQYVCQLHRIRLLHNTPDIKLVPKKLLETPIRLPIKIDLRDVAAWVEKRNSYQNIISEEKFNEKWQNTLEAFIVCHVIYHSSLENFDTNDLIAILRLSPVLFIFDGFDEVANLKSRESIISFINKGLSRLSENASSIQVVITSRPAAFSNSTGFSVELYPHFELTDISPSVMKEYVEKWIKSRRLDSRKALEIRNLVQEKLKVPHLKDLAKSPMQLAILISLLNTRGESLPNKRTALYDSYIELFFNRESEKSDMVRDNRDLIINIHQYLAWTLHSEAELFKNSGRIELAELHKKLNEYLIKEEHEEIISENLFSAIEERVCALVSRVQGTFEFEVQPLREYFAAKFLYNTAPYSTAGNTFNGTKPDRFDAISKNMYWQNVTRFFAGCFDKGELPMLIDKLKELQNDEHLKFTNYPRLLTSQLLSDYVFTQYPKFLKGVVSIIVDGVNLGKILKQNSNFRRNDEPILLPVECGRKEVIIECFNQLEKFPKKDYAEELISLIKNNPYLVCEEWTDRLENISEPKVTEWLSYGYKLGIIFRLDESLIVSILNKSTGIDLLKRLQLIINGNRSEIIDNNINLKKIAFDGILEGKLFYRHRNDKINGLSVLSVLLHSHFLSGPFRDRGYHRSIGDEINSYFSDERISAKTKEKRKTIFDIQPKDDFDKKVKSFLNKVEGVLYLPFDEWRKSITNWNFYVESALEIFGKRPVLLRIALIGANIKAAAEKFNGFSELENDELSLCKRVRCARMKSGNLTYWKERFEIKEQLLLTSKVFYTWATPRTIFKLDDLLKIKLKELNNEQYTELDSTLSLIADVSLFSYVDVSNLEKNLIGNLNNDSKYLLRNRVPFNVRDKFIYDNMSSFDRDYQSLNMIKLQFLIKSFFKEQNNTKILKLIKEVYAKTNQFSLENIRYANNLLRKYERISLPIEVSKIIMENSKDYPKILANIAENTCARWADKQKKMVGRVAEEEEWFELA